MHCNKFEYFLNAVHYSLWKGFTKYGSFAGVMANKLLLPIPKYLFTKKNKIKYYKNIANNKYKIDVLFHDKENGYYVGLANHWFGYFYSCYSGFLAFVSVGFIFKYVGDVSAIAVMLTVSVPIGLCYILAYNAVFKKNRYLKYYKQFEKENNLWHRKWKWMTMAFCIGGVMTVLLGIGVVWCILLL